MWEDTSSPEYQKGREETPFELETLWRQRGRRSALPPEPNIDRLGGGVPIKSVILRQLGRKLPLSPDHSGRRK